jgi:poly-gamma-glutamate system protein
MVLKRPISSKDRLIYILGLISAILLSATLLVVNRNRSFFYDDDERRAFDYMKSAIEIVSADHDLIGPEISDITTTLGDPASKRTSLHPSIAPLIVRLLKESGVRSGDTIAMGCSGSFPGLLIASLSASEAMGIEPRIILSLGSSFYGASDPDFTILDLHMFLYRSGFTGSQPVAVSPGGDRDIGRDFEPAVLERLIKKAEGYNIPLIFEEDLVRNRKIRDSIICYGQPGSIKAFINSGGGHANMGTNSLSLLLKPGLVIKAPMPPQSDRGVIHDMLEKGVPVIHLLHMKGLATRYNIPWDSH